MILKNFVQIAGVKSKQEADLLVECGIKYIGFPLRLPVHKEDITEEIAAEIITGLPSDVSPILITYESRAASIIELSEKVGTSIVQIHGDITIEELSVLRQMKPDWILIKSLVIGLTNHNQIISQLTNYAKFIDAFITDTYDPSSGATGATGKTHDWKVSEKIARESTVPVIIAGGLNHNNVIEAVVETNAIGVDSHTGVEDKYGNKDRYKVKEFLRRSLAALNRVTVDSPASLVIRELEECVMEACPTSTTRPELFVFDLRDARYIEIASALHMLSIIKIRSIHNKYTLFRIPKWLKARDFLRVWDFPGAVKESTGLTFSSLCLTSDIEKYFGENNNDAQRSYNVTTPKDTSLITDDFFSISSYTIDQESIDINTYPVTEESQKWKAPQIQDFLSDNLNPNLEDDGEEEVPATYIPARIVFEAMTNAIRHPKADLILASSHSDHKIKRASKLLTLVFWDSGVPMHKSLKQALKDGEKVRTSIPDDEHFSFDATHFSNSSPTGKHIIPTDMPLSPNTKPCDLLLACFFPGVSQDVEGKTFIPNPDRVTSTPGRGLTDLLNCAIDIFGGEVAIRSDNMFINFKASSPDSSSKYSASIYEYSKPSGAFFGNMVTIRLPIKV